jgi:hypothetical protein
MGQFILRVGQYQPALANQFHAAFSFGWLCELLRVDTLLCCVSCSRGLAVQADYFYLHHPRPFVIAPQVCLEACLGIDSPV